MKHKFFMGWVEDYFLNKVTLMEQRLIVDLTVRLTINKAGVCFRKL